jgi:hypothetical protein
MNSADPQSAPHSESRRTGKIARLPKTTRDRINAMIQDGVSYLDIIEQIGPEAAALNEVNLSHWKSGGYQDWLREQQRAETLKSKHELAMSIVERSPGSNIASQAVLQVIAGNLCEFLADTDPAALRESLLSDADKFTRFVNAMVRLAEGGIKCDLHQEHHQDRAAEAAKQKSVGERPGISEEALSHAEQKLKLL